MCAVILVRSRDQLAVGTEEKRRIPKGLFRKRVLALRIAIPDDDISIRAERGNEVPARLYG